jgi:hypothetical protein
MGAGVMLKEVIDFVVHQINLADALYQPGVY